MDDGENFEIDPELWLTYLLAVNGDPQVRKKLVDRNLQEDRNHS